MAYDSDTSTVVLFGGNLPDGSVSNQTWLFDGTSWHSAAGPSGPAPRAGASMAFDQLHHQLILFGGVGASGNYLNDTWAWNGAQWYQLSPAGSPTSRSGGALAPDPAGDLVLFGGYGPQPAPAGPAAQPAATTPPQTAPSTPTTTSTSTSASVSASADPAATQLSVLGDTWTWDGKNWQQTSPTAAAPSARTTAALAYDPVHDRTVLFGGSSSGPSGSSGSQLGDTWTWDGAAWAHQAPATNPPARSAAAMAGDPAAGGAVLTGGSVGSSPRSDAWVWGGSNWSSLPSAGSPPALTAAGAAFDAAAGDLVVYGGAGASGPSGQTWLLGAATGATPPPQPAAPPPTSGVSTTSPRVMSPAPAQSTPPTTAVTVIRPPAAGTAPQAPAPAPTGATGGTLAPAGSNSAEVEKVHPGARVTLLGAGFRPDSPVSISFHSLPQHVGEVTANRLGQVEVSVAVPADATDGSHHFVLTGVTSDGQPISLETPILVVANPGSRPWDNVETPVMTGISVALPLGTWLVLEVLGRRRTRRVREA